MSFFKKILKNKKPHHLAKDHEVFLGKLKKVIDYSPRDLTYYLKAFTHSSSSILDDTGRPFNYERLEFLGDAILGGVIADYLYKEVPDANEGYLTKMRSKIVSRDHLNELGRDLKLLELLKLNSKKGFSLGENVHGNIFEALIGAIYLDKGFDACNKFIHKKVISQYVDIEKLEGKVISYKSLMIEWCQKNRHTFNFETFEQQSNDNQQYFGVRLSINEKVISKARATSKKKAEEKAAQRAYFVFQDRISRK